LLLLVLLANGEAITVQESGPDALPWFSVPIMLVGMVGAADGLVRVADIPGGEAYWGRLLTFTLVTLMLSSAFFGPFTFGIVRWAAIVIGVPWVLMVWLTVRELVRLVRRPSTPASPPESLSWADRRARHHVVLRPRRLPASSATGPVRRGRPTN